MDELKRKRADERWEQRFAELAEYIRVHRRASVWKKDTARSQLRGWHEEQQKQRRAGKLDAGRQARLAELVKDLSSVNDLWERQFAKLREFRERIGHCRVPAKWKAYSPLARWVQAQRRRKKLGILLPDRVRRLESLGFEWNPPPHVTVNGEAWARMFAHLVRFQQEHGHTEVPRKFRGVPGLAEWKHTQRRMDRDGLLRPDRREQLDAIGFAWKDSYRWRSGRWDMRYAQLLRFREQFGHCRVPQKWKENVPLGGWVQGQRAEKKKGKLSAERIRRLEAIGFEWHGSSGGRCHGPFRQQGSRSLRHNRADHPHGK